MSPELGEHIGLVFAAPTPIREVYSQGGAGLRRRGVSEELRLAWVADAQHFPWMCGPGRRDGPPSETVPTVWEFQAGDPRDPSVQEPTE